jgi:hypothetical protein
MFSFGDFGFCERWLLSLYKRLWPPPLQKIGRKITSMAAA